MGFKFSFNSIFVLTALLIISSAHGIRRGMIEAYDAEEDVNLNLPPMEMGAESREMVELDYVDAGANTNPKSRIFFPPPPAAPPPKH